jgi:hypothetical protein
MAKSQKKWTPILKEKTAEDRKNAELYGKTTKKHPASKKGDSALMMAGSDWKNPSQKHI